ncbi:MAG: type II toxin-antitoxin system RelE/ParE family toxin [Candidatus Uhrbacteria bacterium]|nr:type II toxin-antitoxin system RelE/ParE family toxin [Candidatus Uhrbacteria bacterium]
MKKSIVFDARAVKEFEEFERSVQLSFQSHITILSSEGRLEFPDARKISAEIFEIRIEWGGAYRGLYAYAGKDFIIILHFFNKKSQKTPLKNIAVARQRLKAYV